MKKSVLWIVIFVIVAFGLLYLYFSGRFGGGGWGPTPVPLEPGRIPTGNIDDTTAAILREISAGEDVTPVDSDPTLTAPSDSLINGFDQSFNASQF